MISADDSLMRHAFITSSRLSVLDRFRCLKYRINIKGVYLLIHEHLLL